MRLDPAPSGDTEILPDNIRAVQAVYTAFELEKLRVFDVADRLVQLFEQGLLPLGAGTAPEIVRDAASANRLTRAERAALYAKVLGPPGGDPTGAEPNREFTSLWLRFLGEVANFTQQRSHAAAPPASLLAVPCLRGAARALAANASAHGTGIARAAASLHDAVEAIFELLRDPDVMRAFGARDMWQVIDQVNGRYLGGAVNVHRYRTQAQAGALLLGWLAARADALGRATPADADPAPTDAELVDAAGQWLAAGGAQDDAPHAMVGDLLHRLGLAGAAVARKVALFHGAPGTGKTLAAHVLAAALARDLLRVDLGQLVSKYIGETEKNLDRVFAAARASGAVLLFDEADALFGERSEVKDAHDRYANLEVAWLLQRIEQHDGVVILESNRAPHAEACAGFADVVPFPWAPKKRG